MLLSIGALFRPDYKNVIFHMFIRREVAQKNIFIVMAKYEHLFVTSL